MNRTYNKGIKLTAFERALKDATFFKSRAVSDLAQFEAEVIVVNRSINAIRVSADKVFSRDIFGPA